MLVSRWTTLIIESPEYSTRPGTFKLVLLFLSARSWSQRLKDHSNLLLYWSLSKDEEAFLALENDENVGARDLRMFYFLWWRNMASIELLHSGLKTTYFNQLHNARPVCITKSPDPPLIGI